MMFAGSAIIAVVRYDNNVQWHVVQGNYIRNWVGWFLMAFVEKLLGETREKTAIIREEEKKRERKGERRRERKKEREKKRERERKKERERERE